MDKENILFFMINKFRLRLRSGVCRIREMFLEVVSRKGRLKFFFAESYMKEFPFQVEDSANY